MSVLEAVLRVTENTVFVHARAPCALVYSESVTPATNHILKLYRYIIHTYRGIHACLASSHSLTLYYFSIYNVQQHTPDL